MSVKQHLSVQCPYCHHDIVFYRVKPRFNCEACKTTLGSNRGSVDVWAVLFYVVLAAALWLLAGPQLQTAGLDSTQRIAAIAGVSAFVAIVAYLVIAPRALQVEFDSWANDAPGSAAGRKRKVLTYGDSPDPRSASGQRKIP